MYADPSLIRDNTVKIRLNDPENALIDALVAYTGQQKAALLRSILLDAAQQTLCGDVHIAQFGAQNEGLQMARIGH